MKLQKILSFLNEASDSKFANKNWNIVNDQLNANHSVGDVIFSQFKFCKC